MKPKEYLKKFKLLETEHFNHTAFVSDLTVDFISMIEYQQSVGQYSLSHFQNIVKQLKQKFDSISNKSKMSYENWNKLWKFFYASVVCKQRDRDFGEQIAKEKARRQEKRNRWRSRQKYEYSYGFYEDLIREFFSNALNRMLSTPIVPVKEFGEFGLIPETSTENDVKKEFRKLSLIHHPDKGGDSKMFQRIVENKNRCLAYLSSKYEKVL